MSGARHDRNSGSRRGSNLGISEDAISAGCGVGCLALALLGGGLALVFGTSSPPAWVAPAAIAVAVILGLIAGYQAHVETTESSTQPSSRARYHDCIRSRETTFEVVDGAFGSGQGHFVEVSLARASATDEEITGWSRMGWPTAPGRRLRLPGGTSVDLAEVTAVYKLDEDTVFGFGAVRIPLGRGFGVDLGGLSPSRRVLVGVTLRDDRRFAARMRPDLLREIQAAAFTGPPPDDDQR